MNEPVVEMAKLQSAFLEPGKLETEVKLHAYGQLVDFLHCEPPGLGVMSADVGVELVVQHRQPDLKEELVVSHGRSIA